MSKIRNMNMKTQLWKYGGLKSYLDSIREVYEFEFEVMVNNHIYYIYDLVLKNRRVIIEFDGPNHNYKLQRHIDEEKNILAEELGYVIERVEVEANTIIDPNLIIPILQKYSLL